MENKVLFTASTFSHIKNFHLPYLRAFRALGWQVHVACGGEPPEMPEADRVIALPFEKSMFSPGNLKAAGMLRRLIESEGYALVTTHTSLAAFFTRLALKGMARRPKLACVCHGYLFDDATPAPKRALLLAAERAAAPQTDLLLAMNAWDLAEAEKFALGARVAYIPGMGVDFSRLDGPGAAERGALRLELGIPEDAFVLIYPAEFSRRKSQSVLIEAMAALPEGCFLVLPGQGRLLEDCRALARKLGLEKRVIFPGQIGDMAPWYAMSDALATSSRSEGLPFNVMEAMHCGLPVAASNVKGHSDLLAASGAGILYPYGDAGACAGAIRRLMAEPGLRAQLSQRGREASRDYDIDAVLPRVMEAYLSLLPEAVPEPLATAEN